MRSITFKIPVYNEGKSIYDLIKRIESIREKFQSIHVHIYDDGSNSPTKDWIKKALSDFNKLKFDVKFNEKNYGLRTALNALILDFKENDSDHFIFLDGDNTHDPTQLIENKRIFQSDVVLFSRFVEGATLKLSLFRRILSNGAALVYAYAFRQSFREYTCLYRIFSKEIFNYLREECSKKPLEEEGFVCAVEMLFKANLSKYSINEFPLRLQYELKVEASNNKILQNIFRTLLFAFKVYLRKK